MIHDNIRKYRKERGLSQEEMAVRLHVVRQTVSKWENGKSVPDAGVLIDMAALFEVPVSKLLGDEADRVDTENLAEKLAALNEEHAEKNHRETLMKRAGEKLKELRANADLKAFLLPYGVSEQEALHNHVTEKPLIDFLKEWGEKKHIQIKKAV